MKQRLYIFLLTLLTCVNAAWGQKTDSYDYDGDGNFETYTVVYLNLGSGSDSKAGDSPANAVKTWAKAYSKLPAYTGATDADRDAAWDSNIIVVCDAQGSGNLFIDETVAKGTGTKGIPATITGIWPWNAENTTATKVKAGGRVYLNSSAHNGTVDKGTTRIGADTKFKYVRFGGASAFLSMYLHDCMFDVGCVMDITSDLITTNGATSGRRAPDMQVFLFANTYNFNTDSNDGGWPQQTKPVTLTIKSGKFGRILSNRITGTKKEDIVKRYVIGNPSNPLMCVVNVDIDPETSTGAWNSRVGKEDKDDIAFLCAGMTQGAEYCDVQFNIKRGKIATLVGAMQGMSIEKTKDAGLSNSSFFGRTVTNIIPENDEDVTIQRYYAACLGRATLGDNTRGMVNATFYGHSTLNMFGGTIESGAFVSAGGISGLKNSDGKYYTNDQYIPYVDNTASAKYPYMGIKYQPYDAGKTITKVTSSMYKANEEIDLAETVTAMNIYGGTIKGGLYGGSYGYSAEMDVSVTMAGAGSLWGETNVNVYGGTIEGGVYGGGYGATDYYTKAANDKKKDFLTVASVYGNTNVNIYGGSIAGNIYGGGAGVAATGAVGTDTEFLDIAKVYGNTNVIIDPRTLKDRTEWTDPNVPEFTGPNESWTFTGNIYGGGALGAVEGATNIVIKGGTINGNVFGAGMGEDGHPNKAKVTGDTNVTVGE